ncbi:MAG: hypothetical protein [Circular genetic element sp.]|nr:MAG: hypothetical protein [Circular genetic element sp.]
MPYAYRYKKPKNAKQRAHNKKRRIVNNYKTAVRGKSGRATIRPQNNVPLQSVIGLRYKQTIDTSTIPVHIGAGVEQSGLGFSVNMSDPTSAGLITVAFGSQTTGGGFQLSNLAATGGQDNLTQAITDAGLYTKYDHFYVRKSIINVKIRGKPNQWKLDKWLQTQTDANDNKYLQDRYPDLDGDLYNFAVMSDANGTLPGLVDASVLKVRHQTAGVKLRKSTIFSHSAGKDASFRMVYTPKRLGISDPQDNRSIIGWTKQSNVAENSFAQFVVGKQMFPVAGVNSANSVIDISIDYEIIACERRINDNDAVIRPLPGSQHRGDL